MLGGGAERGSGAGGRAQGRHIVSYPSTRVKQQSPKCFFGPFRYDGGRQRRSARVLAVPNNGPGQATCMPSLGSPGSRRGRDRDAVDARRGSGPRRGSDACFGPRSAMLARKRAPGRGVDVGGSGEVGKRLGLSCGGRTVTCNLSARRSSTGAPDADGN